MHEKVRRQRAFNISDLYERSSSSLSHAFESLLNTHHSIMENLCLSSVLLNTTEGMNTWKSMSIYTNLHTWLAKVQLSHPFLKMCTYIYMELKLCTSSLNFLQFLELLSYRNIQPSKQTQVGKSD